MLYEHFELTNVKISRAGFKHPGLILKMISPYIEQDIILPRTEDDIRKNIDSFFVAEKNDEVIGCTAVKDFGAGLYEIRSLAVKPEHAGQGVGSALISYIVDYVKNIKNGRKVFALTLRPNVFTIVGFKLVVKEMFPEKVWNDCSVCKKKDHCDEVAVLYDLDALNS